MNPQKLARQEKIDWIRTVAAEDGEGCREWPWNRNPKGYGGVRWNGRTRLVGHVMLNLSGRPRPSAAHHQLHSCDNPTCVAPWHLRWGSNVENRRDSVERGRHFTKLTPEQVLVIYRSRERQRDVAAMFGVTQRVVGDIKRGHKWSRVTGHQPLPDAPPPNPNASRIAELRAEWAGAEADRKAEIEAEVKALQAGGPA